MQGKYGLMSLVAVLLMLLAAPVMALDEDTVNRWADSMEALQEWAEREDIDNEPVTEIEDPMEADFERMLAESAREHSEAEQIIRDAGFSSTEEWASIGDRIFNAWIAEEMAADADDMEAGMSEALREIEENPHMSAEQKQMMRQQLEQVQGMQAEIADAPEADRRAVRQARPRLERVLDVPEAPASEE